MGHILWTIIIGFVVGIIARLFVHGPGAPQGFVLTSIIGIAGSFSASYIGQSVGWYQPGEAAGWIASIIGACILLGIWGAVARNSSNN